jgi:tripartite-type tricarboxylate transporter receptor subunit TctC
VIETLAGQVRMTIGSVPAVLPHVRAGKLKALALTASKRSATAPEYPTIAEAGVPGFEAASWHGALLPAGAPPALAARIQREIAGVLALDDVKVRIHREGLDIVASTPQAFDVHIRAELARWANVVKSAGIPVE